MTTWRVVVTPPTEAGRAGFMDRGGDPSADRGPGVFGDEPDDLPGLSFRCFQVRFVEQYETGPDEGQRFSGYLELVIETT